MANKQLTKFGVPIIGQAISSTGSVRHQTGTCGIEPLKMAGRPPPPPPAKLPEHLIRPPCQPGGFVSTEMPNCQRTQAFFCPPQKIKYRYPPFSDNIDFVPTGEVECWWAKPRKCEMPKEDEIDSLFKP